MCPSYLALEAGPWQQHVKTKLADDGERHSGEAVTNSVCLGEPIFSEIP